MIAHVVFDLPMEGHFDYLIPEALAPLVAPGVRVEVSFGSGVRIGFVIGTCGHSDVGRLKPIKALKDKYPVFNSKDLAFARAFAAYYGCSLGEALMTSTRHRKGPCHAASESALPKASSVSVYQCLGGQYDKALDLATKKHDDFFIVLPDAFASQVLAERYRSKAGLRSAMFEVFGTQGLVVVVDDDNISHQQEQTPMYETRQVVLMAQGVYGFDVAFVGATPSVEVMHQAMHLQWPLIKAEGVAPKAVAVVDLSNYKYLEKGMLSIPLRNAISNAITQKTKALLVLNRKGAYAVTRCKDCGLTLTCRRCSSPLTFSRTNKEYICRFCASKEPASAQCPQCRKPSFKSFGMGVEQLQAELKSVFPLARIACFESGTMQQLPACDILIATQAVLRFRAVFKPGCIGVIDFDGELNRSDIRCSHRAWALVTHLGQMTPAKVIVQTRNPDNYVIRALLRANPQEFYQEELRLREELGVCPFKHWVAVVIRAKGEKIAAAHAQGVYNELLKTTPKGVCVLGVEAEQVFKKRDYFRFRVMVQGEEVVALMGFVKGCLGKVKLKKGIFVTLKVDP